MPLFWHLSRHVVTLLQGACRVFNAAWSRLSNTWVLRKCNERSMGPWLKLAVLREFKRNLVPNLTFNKLNFGSLKTLFHDLGMRRDNKAYTVYKNVYTVFKKNQKTLLKQMAQRFSQTSVSLLAEGIFPIASFKITITLSWHLHLAFLGLRGATVLRILMQMDLSNAVVPVALMRTGEDYKKP